MSDEITLRDTFAAAALTGLLAAPTDKDRSSEYWARFSYEIADAMLRERERVEEAAAEIERLRLTAEEREAIKVCESVYSDNDMDAECWRIAATLRALLKRLA
jgi:hypothetical protein